MYVESLRKTVIHFACVYNFQIYVSNAINDIDVATRTMKSTYTTGLHYTSHISIDEYPINSPPVYV